MEKSVLYFATDVTLLLAMLEILLKEPYSLQSILRNGTAKGIAKWN
jgi:hypothetical protein